MEETFVEVTKAIKELAIVNRLNLRDYISKGKVDLSKIIDTLVDIGVISEDAHVKFEQTLSKP